MTDTRNAAADAARGDDSAHSALKGATVTTGPSAHPSVAGRRASPTLEDVAAAAGVSRSTASRAINGGRRVSADALAAVEAAVLRLGFSPNRAARTLVTHRADSVALVVPEPDDTSCPGGVAGSALSPGRRT